MIKRLAVGLVLGFALGAAVAAGVVQGLGWVTFDAGVLGVATAYVFALATGALTGLIAGKPIWSKGGAIEAGLKAFFGAVLAAGGMFAVRTWLHTNVDLEMLHAGQGAIGDLPAASLPLLAAVLGGFFELDNTPEAEGAKRGNGEKARVAAKVRVAPQADEEETEAAAPAAKKRTR
jgi:hypothetical protein